MIAVFKFNCKRKIQHLTRWFKINDEFKELTAFPSQKQTNVNLMTFKQQVSSSHVMTSQCHMTHSWCEPCGAWLQPAASEPCTTWFPDSISSSDARGIIFSDQAVRPHMPPASWHAASQHRCNVDVSSRSCLTEWQPGAEGGSSGPAAWTKSTCSFWSGCHNFSWASSLFSWKASPEADPQANSSPACATRPAVTDSLICLQVTANC